MTTIIVLFNLHSDANVAAYKTWATSTDMPAVRHLPSVKRFEVLEMTQMISGALETPYQYVEIIEVENMDDFRADVKDEAIQTAAKEFRKFADDPKFIVCQSIDS